MPIPSSPVEARGIIKEIAEEYGWISQADREQTPQNVLQALSNLQNGLGSAARTLATNLYKSNTRFLFELIQNAEDNSYSRAKAAGAEPYIKFTIRPNRIIIDSNEDGFTTDNVRAICKIGESTKIRTGSQYYIGEKGIGFKSVFMVASKVHIQSPPWSFSFNHKERDSGMGMVTPEWESDDVLLEEPLTRITLTLIDSVDLDDLLSQFDDLPSTVLLFLNKLGKIIIDEDVQENQDIHRDADGQWDEHSQDDEEFFSFDDEDEGNDDDGDGDDGDDDDEKNQNLQERQPKMRVKCITTYSCDFDQNIKRAKVTVLRHRIMRPDSYSEDYRITRKSLSNLPTGTHHDYNTAEVILGFPVHNFLGDDRPHIRPQQVYAYLPIRDFGFPFIIHSDFVTQASREDIMENARNTAILDGVAEAFVDAVVQFCQQQVLQYRWMHYLPEDDRVSSPFWSRLLIRIKERIKETPILWPRSRTGLRLISQLRILPKRFRDHNGEPLVADLPEINRERYLDPNYDLKVNNALSKLKTLGLAEMNTYDFIERIGRDANSLVSRMKSADDSWHERVAHILLPVLEKDLSKKAITYIRHLPLIPLGDHRWVSITTDEVYFRETDGMPIPSDLGLRLVDSKAALNATRKKLFVELGVIDASKEHIKMLILNKHKKFRENITLDSSAGHLNYLYWTDNQSGNTVLRKLSPFSLFNNRNIAVDGEHDLYFQTDKKYGIQEYFNLALEDTQGSDPFGSFINKRYFESAPGRKKGSDSLSFEAWLQRFVGILRSPRLNNPKNPHKLSKVFSYIVTKHPERLLGTLKAHWSSEYKFTINDELTKKLSEVVIPSTNIGRKKLQETFLPLKELVTHCKQFLDPEIFPFLILDDDSGIEQWKFLEIFGIGMESNLDFYLEILRRFKEKKVAFSYRIYEEIQRKIWASKEPTNLIEHVKDTVRDEDLIFTPTLHRNDNWTWEDECVWDGPAYLSVKYALLPALSTVKSGALTAFFVETMEISDVSTGDLLAELLAIKRHSLKNSSTPNLWNVRDIYTRLQNMASPPTSPKLETIKKRFEKKSFIYDNLRKTWVAPSSCLWSKDAQIPGKVAILSQYEDLKDFFVGTLKVNIPDLGMLVDELSRVVSSKLTVSDVKSLIWQINSFSPSRKALEKLNTLPIFPVKVTNRGLDPTVLRARKENFSIIDRQPWAEAFEGKIDVLDFKLEEVRRLQPFLSCLNLENRYLSRVVRETSSFQGGNGEQSRTQTRRLRSRAHALARCAAHFGSPRIRDDDLFIYRLLLRAEMYQTDGIVTSLVHTHHLETVTVEVHRSKLHIAENSASLKIYVPKDRKDHELCFLQLLPTKLFNQVIMGYKTGNSTHASDSEAVRIIAALFMSSDEVVCDLLDDAGIIPVPYPDEFNIETSENPSPTAEPTSQHEDPPPVNKKSKTREPSKERRSQSPQENTTSPGPKFLSPTPRSSYRTKHREGAPKDPPINSFSSRPSTPQSDDSVPFSANSGQAEYRRLLNNVIAAAKSKKGGFPARGAFRLDDLLNALPTESDAEPVSYDLPFGVRSENQLAHDMKVGAAGELYVFEILSRLEIRLPGFGRDNWQSTIRRHVKVHEDYNDMEAWKGAETADITYDDNKGELTKLLVANGYLDNIWIGAKPKYYLEVKTTIKECGTRFFVSKSQYQRMERMRLITGEVSLEVYIIFRVFNLDKETIDMRVYVDPKGIEEGGDLIFTPESYSVLPAGSIST